MIFDKYFPLLTEIALVLICLKNTMHQLAKYLLPLFCLLFLPDLNYGQTQTTDSSTIVLKAINCQHSNYVYLSYTSGNEVFNKLFGERVDISSSVTKTFRIKISNPLIFNVYGRYLQGITGILLPGDSITINLDFTSLDSCKYKFEGNSASLCDYYTSFWRDSSGYRFRRILNASPSKDYLPIFAQFEDYYRYRLNYFDKYVLSNDLPDWFISYEMENILYEVYSHMLRLIHLNNTNNFPKLYANPELLLWFRDVPVDNLKALSNDQYFNFLWQYFLWKNKIFWILGSEQKVQLNWIPKIMPAVKAELKDATQEWFITKMLVNYYSKFNLSGVDSVYASFKPEIKDPQNIKLLEEAREKAIFLKNQRFSKSAKIGNKAPGFYLKDTLNKVYSIQNFKGKWTLISFCNSSLDSKTDSIFEFYNALSTSDKSNIQFVNIYKSSDSFLLKNNQNKKLGVETHLFCKGNWAEILTDQYGLEGFPYFVLVNPDGFIQYSKPYIFSEAFHVFQNELISKSNENN